MTIDAIASTHYENIRQYLQQKSTSSEVLRNAVSFSSVQLGFRIEWSSEYFLLSVYQRMYLFFYFLINDVLIMSGYRDPIIKEQDGRWIIDWKGVW
jgi:hypothetical protein